MTGSLSDVLTKLANSISTDEMRRLNTKLIVTSGMWGKLLESGFGRTGSRISDLEFGMRNLELRVLFFVL
jgi:hypothetical protein